MGRLLFCFSPGKLSMVPSEVSSQYGKIFSYGPNVTIAVAIHYGLGVPEPEAGFWNAQQTLIVGPSDTCNLTR